MRVLRIKTFWFAASFAVSLLLLFFAGMVTDEDIVLRDMHEPYEGDLADDELDNVSGGAEGCKPANLHEVEYWNSEDEVQFLFQVGDLVQVLALMRNHHTVACKVANRRASRKKNGKWFDEYWLEKQPGGRAEFSNGWHARDHIEK